MIVKRHYWHKMSVFINNGHIHIIPDLQKIHLLVFQQQNAEWVTHSQPELVAIQRLVCGPVRLRLFDGPLLAETVQIGNLEVEVMVALRILVMCPLGKVSTLRPY